MNYYFQILTVIMINSILAVSLNLVSGYTGQLSLGHATFMGLGAYAATLFTLKLHLPFLASIILGATVAAFFGFVIGVPTLRLKGDYLAIATLGFGEIMKTSFSIFKSREALWVFAVYRRSLISMWQRQH